MAADGPDAYWRKGLSIRPVYILGPFQPLCESMLSLEYDFILTCKYTSHKYLAEWIEAGDPKEDLHEQVIKRWTGKERLFFRYRFANDVPLKDGEDALRVNWASAGFQSNRLSLSYSPGDF